MKKITALFSSPFFFPPFSEYEFKRGFATPIIFIFNLHRNVPSFYDIFGSKKSPLLQN